MPPRSKSPPRTRSKTGKTPKKAKKWEEESADFVATPISPTKEKATVFLGGKPLPTVEQRTKWLQMIEKKRPKLVGFYALSCWMYSVTGLFYLYVLPKLQPGYETTPLMSGTLFGCLLTLQGALSYANDGLVTLGRPLKPNRMFWVISDRLCAWTLMLTTFGCVATWPSAGPGDARNYVSAALAVTCIIAYPSSKTCEVTGRMMSFLIWHSIWHYVPCALAIVWIGMGADWS